MTRQGAIQAVTFDAGGTLVDPWPSVGHVYATVAREMHLPCDEPALLNERFAAAWRARAAFDYSREAWAQIVVNTFQGHDDTHGAATPLFQQIYSRFTEAHAWRVHPDVLPTLRALQQLGVRLAVISNWDDRLPSLLRNLQLDSFFEMIEVSVQSGFHKPAPEIFHRVLERMQLSPRHVLHVGDSLIEDVRGAEAAGLRAVWLRRDKAQTGAIAGLDEIVRLL